MTASTCSTPNPPFLMTGVLYIPGRDGRTLDGMLCVRLVTFVEFEKYKHRLVVDQVSTQCVRLDRGTGSDAIACLDWSDVVTVKIDGEEIWLTSSASTAPPAQESGERKGQTCRVHSTITPLLHCMQRIREL